MCSQYIRALNLMSCQPAQTPLTFNPYAHGNQQASQILMCVMLVSASKRKERKGWKNQDMDVRHDEVSMYLANRL